MAFKIYACIFSLALISLAGSFHHFHPHFTQTPTRIFQQAQTQQSEPSQIEEDTTTKRKTLALYYLDCLTSPNDQEDPDYDPEKYRIRQRLINENTYADLRTHCRLRAMRGGSDKIDMLIRLYANEVDSSVIVPDLLEPSTINNKAINNYPDINPDTGDVIKDEDGDSVGEPDAEVRFVSDEDLFTGEVTVKQPQQPSNTATDDSQTFRTPPDCDDLRLLGSTYRRTASSRRPASPLIIPDGMLRSEVTIPRISLQYPHMPTDKKAVPKIEGYLCVSQSLLKSWQAMSTTTNRDQLKLGYNALRPQAIVIILPHDIGTSTKAKRVLVDEIAAMSNAAVLLIELRPTTNAKAVKDEILSCIAYFHQLQSSDDDEVVGVQRRYPTLDPQGLQLPPNSLPPIDSVSLMTYGSASGVVSSLAGDLQAICCQHVASILATDGLDTIIDTAQDKDIDSDDNWDHMTRQREVLSSWKVFGEIEPRIFTPRGEAERFGRPWPPTAAASTVDSAPTTTAAEEADNDSNDEEEDGDEEMQVLEDPIRSAKVDAILSSSLDELLSLQEATAKATQEATGEGDLLRLALAEGGSLEFARSLDPLGYDKKEEEEDSQDNESDTELTKEILRNRYSFSLQQQLSTLKRLSLTAKGLVHDDGRHCELSMTQIAKMRPSSLILIHPANSHDSKLDLSRLTLPTLLLYSGVIGEEKARESHRFLSACQQQITDYLIRLYPTNSADNSRWIIDLPQENEIDEEDEGDSEWWKPTSTSRLPLSLDSRVRLDMIDTIGKWIPFVSPSLSPRSNNRRRRRVSSSSSSQLPEWLTKELPQLLEQQQSTQPTYIRPKAEPPRWKRRQRTVQKVKEEDLQRLPAGLVNRHLHDPSGGYYEEGGEEDAVELELRQKK